MKKFTRVSLDKELRADADGMPVFRRCFYHEWLLSFFDDCGAEAFELWWEDKGSEQFAEWMAKNEFEDCID